MESDLVGIRVRYLLFSMYQLKLTVSLITTSAIQYLVTEKVAENIFSNIPYVSIICYLYFTPFQFGNYLTYPRIYSIQLYL